MGAIAFPGRKGEAKTETPRDQYLQRATSNVISLFDAGHDMFLIGDVQCVTLSCGQRAKATMANRALTYPELRALKNAFEAHLFAGTPSDIRRIDRLKRLRDSLVRILNSKLDTLRDETIPPDFEHEQAALDDIWHDAFAFRLQRRERAGLSGDVAIVQFMREEMPEGATVLARRASLTGNAVAPSVSRMGTAEETAETDLGRPDQEMYGMLINQLRDKFSHVLNHDALRCSRNRTLVAPQQVVAADGPLGLAEPRAPEDDWWADETNDVDGDGATSSKALDQCIAREFDYFIGVVGDPRRYEAIVLVARRQTDWNDAVSFVTLLRKQMLRKGLSTQDVDRQLSRVFLVADGRTNMLATRRPQGPIYDDAILPRVNLFIPFTGYSEHADRAAQRLTELIAEGTSQLNMNPPPIPISMFDPLTIRRTECPVDLETAGLLPR